MNYHAQHTETREPGVQLGSLLDHLGVVDTTRHDDVTAHLTAVLSARGIHDFTVASLQRNRLTVATDAQSVALLRYDTDTVLTDLNDRLDEPVRALRLTVTRTGYPTPSRTH